MEKHPEGWQSSLPLPLIQGIIRLLSSNPKLTAIFQVLGEKEYRVCAKTVILKFLPKPFPALLRIFWADLLMKDNYNIEYDLTFLDDGRIIGPVAHVCCGTTP